MRNRILVCLYSVFMLGASSVGHSQTCESLFQGRPDSIQNPDPIQKIETELSKLNPNGQGWAEFDSTIWLPENFTRVVAELENSKLFPFDQESTYLIKDFENYDLRKQVSPEAELSREVVAIFAFNEKLRSALELSLGLDPSTQKLIESFSEIRVSNHKSKYERPHYDEKVNDFVAVTPITRKLGTLYFDRQTKAWRQAKGSAGTPSCCRPPIRPGRPCIMLRPAPWESLS